MSVYLGYYRVTPGFAEANAARARSGEASIDPKFRQMVIDLPGKLPANCRIIGSYAPMGTDLPAVMIAETNNTDDLFFISQYYNGYLQYQWVPARAVGTTAAERERYLASVAAPAGVR
ncbi:MAG TPA: hypothetical protein VKV26_03615 [Dehalococcoidia bacterium]|nr:hypothetical protein [Dehalococcoidia bacterium]